MVTILQEFDQKNGVFQDLPRQKPINCKESVK